MLTLVVHVQIRVLTALARRGERGQAAAEYALVLLAAATVAALVGKWAAGTKLIGRLFDAVLDGVLDKAR